eukprot:TRINITY_DN47615_c0_g1_i1.p1 TRINITY_DN47615_c0_g1~~TRINITY_DN47615_c0_g1_i1.p1  ORF type:complete len:161 (+),score=23.12 TRINITY_DN47615_c0_g1_i1:104-586(+)
MTGTLPFLLLLRWTLLLRSAVAADTIGVRAVSPHAQIDVLDKRVFSSLRNKTQAATGSPDGRGSLVRRQATISKLQVDCPITDGSTALTDADNNCDCGNNQTKCSVGQFCLGSSAICFNDCVYNTNKYISYNGVERCKCGTVICDMNTHAQCDSESNECT